MRPKTFNTVLLFTCLILPFLAFAAHAGGLADLTQAPDLARLVVMLTGGAAMTFGAGRLQADKQLTDVTAFGAGSGTTVCGGLDLEVGDKSDFVAGAELLIETPLLTGAEMLAAGTLTYDVYHDTASDFSTEELLADNTIVYTSPAGSGLPAATHRVGLPTNVKRYVRVKAVTADASTRTAKSITTRIAT